MSSLCFADENTKTWKYHNKTKLWIFPVRLFILLSYAFFILFATLIHKTGKLFLIFFLFCSHNKGKIKIKFSYAAGNCINFAKCSEKFSNFAFHFTIAATFLCLAETFLFFSNHFLVGKLSSRLSESVENWRPHTRAAQWKLKIVSLFESLFSRGTIFRHIFFLFYALRKRKNVYNFVSLSGWL